VLAELLAVAAAGGIQVIDALERVALFPVTISLGV